MSDPSFLPPRPQTPQAMLHRLPDKPEDAGLENTPPLKYIVLIMGSTAVAGKVQIATSVSKALSCPLYQGDSLHESSAKAAGLGTSRQAALAVGDPDAAVASGPNEARYRRMWLSKMTRTGLLFPEESRPATQGFSGFGGSGGASASTSRRGSASSVASASSDIASSDVSSIFSGHAGPGARPAPQYVHAPAFPASEKEALRRANPALLVLTHPELERWHKLCVKEAVGEYGVGVVFVPLYDDDDFPRLRPLNHRLSTSFASFGGPNSAVETPGGSLTADDVLRVEIDADVEAITDEIVRGARELMKIKP